MTNKFSLLSLGGGAWWAHLLLPAAPDKEESHRLTKLFARQALETMGFPPDTVAYAPSGKPVWENGAPYLSVSHTGRFWCAVAAPAPCGIDAEKTGTSRENVALRWFSPAERLLPFDRVWTAKEAVSKISGKGLGALRQIAVEGDTARMEGERFRLLFPEADGITVTVALQA